jgi:hypothetical protein
VQPTSQNKIASQSAPPWSKGVGEAMKTKARFASQNCDECCGGNKFETSFPVFVSFICFERLTTLSSFLLVTRTMKQKRNYYSFFKKEKI